MAIRLYIQKAESRGLTPDVNKFEKQMEGIATISDEGGIERSKDLQQWLEAHGGEDAEPEMRGTKRKAPESENTSNKRRIKFDSGGWANTE